MRIAKRMLALLTAALMAVVTLGTYVPAYAHDVPDMGRTGSVSVSMTYDGSAVPGGTLTLYRVGDVVEDDGNYSFALTADFAGSGVSLEDVDSPEAAQELATWASEHRVPGTAKTINSAGRVSFSDLDLGLYLAVQNQPASGYRATSPFLVGVPQNDNGTYVYDVDASPKTELAKAPKPDKVPSTGEPELPVGTLLVAGGALCAVAAGAFVLNRRRANHDEA